VSYRPLRILQIPVCKILHFCTGGHKENCLLGCDAMLSGSGGVIVSEDPATPIFRVVDDGHSRFL